MKYLQLAVVLGLIPASPVLADSPQRENALKLPQTLITGNRQVEARSDSTSANSVFTRDDIDRLQPTSLTDLLGRVPGVQVARSGGRGGLPGIYIRGTKSAQSLVLVDGQRGGGIFGGPHYSAAKAGVLGLGKAMARELGPDNIRVNSIAPGLIHTDITGGLMQDERRHAIIDGIPLGRLGQAQDVANAALFLASDLSAYLTGITLDVNGGMLIH